MDVSELSASHQNYLKAIWGLQEWSAEPVTKTMLAHRVGVKLSTASDAVRKLTEMGLVEDTRYGAVSLSPLGTTVAVDMVRRHRLIETFLVTHLDFTWDQVHEEAEALEHAVSNFLVDRIDQKLGFPDRDPHGDPIPRADGTVPRVAAISLGAVQPETPVTVERISDEDPELLKYVECIGITPGARMEVRDDGPFSAGVNVSVNGQSAVTLNAAVIAAVWVRQD